MLDLRQYNSLGEALRAALDRWPNEICLIEADRDRENARLTYRQFKEQALPLASALQSAGLQDGARAAIIMTNQSKWLISAYAIFFCGGVLVPLDYKLTAAEQLHLLAHSRAEFLVIEYHLWRGITQAEQFKNLAVRTVLVTEAPPNADLAGAQRWEHFGVANEPTFTPRKRNDAACIVYSSGTGGRPKGCVLTHENYLEQCVALTSLYPFWPGVRYLSILPTNHAIDFMVGFIGPFTCGATVVHLRTLRPEFIREAFTKYKITYMALVPMILKNLERGLRQRFAELPSGKRNILNALIATNRALTRRRPHLKISRALLPQVHQALHDDHSERSKALPFRHRWQAAPRDGSKNREPQRRRNRRSHRAQPHTHVPLPGRSRNDRGNHRGRLAHDRRSGPPRPLRPSPTLRPQKKHDRYRRRQKYLS